MRTTLLNSFYPAGELIERSNVHDVECIGDQIYIATTDGVYSARQGQSSAFSRLTSFRAEALQAWEDRLLCIGKKEFLWHDPRTEKQEQKDIVWPRKNLLSQKLREDKRGRRSVIHEHESEPFLRRAQIANGRLYLLYHFTKPNGERKAENEIEVGFLSGEREGILCVYSLSELVLENHYPLTCSSWDFAIYDPFIFYPGGGTECPTLYRTDMRTGDALQHRLSEICYAVCCDGTRVFAPQEHCMHVFKVEDFTPVGEFDLPQLMKEYSESLKNALVQNKAMELELGYPQYDSFCALHKDMAECEREGLWYAISGNSTPYHCIEGCAIDGAHGVLAVSTELGSAPGFLWDTVNGKPLCWLLDGRNTVVARKAKLRWPIVMINAHESAHVWKITQDS